jgi:hypothetical protein
MKHNETQLQQALKNHESQIGGMTLTLCIPNTKTPKGVIQTVQQRCRQSQMHQQASMHANTQARKHHSTTMNGHIEDA